MTSLRHSQQITLRGVARASPPGTESEMCAIEVTEPIEPTEPTEPTLHLSDGSLYREQSRPEVYVIYGGAKFWIPSPEELAALGFTWAQVKVVPDGSLVSVPDRPRDNTLLRERSRPEVFLMRGGSKFWIPSPDALTGLGFTWSHVKVVPNGALQQFPQGPQEALAPGGHCIVHPQQLGFAGIHAALLRSGKVLFFSCEQPRENDINWGLWQLFDPRGGGQVGSLGTFNRNLFCSGHCFLLDGSLLVAGGQSNNFPVPGSPLPGVWGADHDVHVFNPVNERWSRHKDMPVARYYPTCITLADGDGLIAGGAGNRVTHYPNDEYEMFSWRTQQKGEPRRFNRGNVGMYPFMHLLPDGTPNGTLFVFWENTARLFRLNANQTGTWITTAFRTALPFSRTYKFQGSCVLLPLLPEAPERVRVLVVGGQGEEGGDHRATNTAEIFEFNRVNPTQSRWRAPAGGNMRFRRFMSDSVLLADGTVLVVNGAGRGEADHSHDAAMEAELFDPATEKWRPLARINRERLYHSSALLLPDGRVIIAGHSEHWNPDKPVEEKTIELFSPPYLFKGVRPTIHAAPSAVRYATDFTIDTPEAEQIKWVALVRAGSTTHTNNMDQRYVGLAIQSRQAGRLNVRAPQNGTVAPPGVYMLFIVSQTGVPAVARLVQLGPFAEIRYGSVVKLKHGLTYQTLHSHVQTYGHPGTSGQQQVTAFPGYDDNDLWRVKGPHGQPENYRVGQPVQHGHIVRLEHLLTRRNLHSHAGHPSPVTRQQEVTCFGASGIGDSNDNWRVEVESAGPWMAGPRARLIHANTNHALHSHEGFFHPEWTMGQQEVTCFPGRDDNDWWLLFEAR